MKNLLTAFCAVLCLGLFSCQKEVDDIFAGNRGNGNNNSGLLKRMALKDGSDSSITDFFYNGNAKLIAVNTTNIAGGSSGFNNQTIERNSQGMVQKIITKASDLAQLGLDSIAITVRSSSGRYINRVWKLSVLGFTISDSTVFTYDASGKIVSEAEFLDDGQGSLTSARTDYSFAGSNLVSVKSYDLSSGSPVLNYTYLFEYDTKASPLVVANEAFVLNNFILWYSANNLKKMTVNVVGDPDTHVETWDYIYNTLNKPLSATVTQDGQNIAATYYYN